MIRKDYIVRMIEQLGAFLWAIIFNKKMNQFDQALFTVDEAWKGLLDLDRSTIVSLDTKTLLARYTKNNEIETEAVEVIASLLFEEADIYELKSGPDSESQNLFQRSFILFDVLQHNYPDKKYQEKRDEVYAKLQNDFLQPETLRVLCVYCEEKGMYAKAEDCYYSLMDAGEESARTDCILFYQRILVLPGEILENGGLPKQEIIEGMKKLEEGKIP